MTSLQELTKAPEFVQEYRKLDDEFEIARKLIQSGSDRARSGKRIARRSRLMERPETMKKT